MAEAEDPGFTQDPVVDQGDASKTIHRLNLDQRTLHGWIAQVMPLLHQVKLQHGFQQVGNSAVFGNRFGKIGMNQIDQRLLGHNCLHQAEKKLT